jgi:hypothetical protein
MKNTLIISLLAVAITHMPLWAQNKKGSAVYSESIIKKNTQAASMTEQPTNGKNYPDKTYFSKYYRPKNMSGSFKLGYAVPMGFLADAPSSEKAIDAPYIGQDGFGMGPGYLVSLEGYGNLNPKSKSFWIKIPIGINAVLGHKPDWSSINSNIEFKPLSILGLGTGLMLNASVKDIFALTFYYKANLMVLLSEPVFTLNDSKRSYEMEVYDSGSDPFNYFTVIGGEIQFSYNWSIFAEVSDATIKSAYRMRYTDWFGSGTQTFNAGFPYRTLTVGLAYVFNTKTN